MLGNLFTLIMALHLLGRNWCATISVLLVLGVISAVELAWRLLLVVIA